MTKTPKRPRDPNQLAKLIVDIATGNEPEQTSRAAPPERGKSGGQARASALSPERRAEIARKAAEKRWAKK